MRGAGMRRRFAGVAVGVEMHRAVTVAMPVKMHAVAPEPPQHMRAETDQHDADGGLDRTCDRLGDRVAEQDGGAGESKQRQRMAKPPGQPVLDDVTDMAAARGDAGYGGDVVGLERVLHAQQKPKPQNSEHMPPARVAVASNTRSQPLSGQHFIKQALHRRP